QDNIDPIVLTQNITVQLDENGLASITTTDIDNGSSDNCTIATMSLDVTDFDCEDVGENTVTLTVTDVNGNSASATAVVTVEDNIAPTVTNPGDQIVDSGVNCSALLADYTTDLIYSDNCSIGDLIQTPAPGSTYDMDAGIVSVSIEVIDESGNSTTVAFDVNIFDQYVFDITSVDFGNITTCNEWPDGYIVINSTLDSNLLLYNIYETNSWQGFNNHFNDLAAGTYNVQVKNLNGCVKQWDTPIVILPAPELTLDNIIVTNIETCFGADNGEIEIIASGGSGDFMYSIDNGDTWNENSVFENLSPGTYQIQIMDAVGCNYIHDEAITITQPEQLLYSEVSYTHVEGCYGNANGSISVTTTGGTGNIEVSVDFGQNWISQTTVANLDEGNYYLMIRDANECELYYENNPIQITQPQELEITNVEMSEIVCGQETVTLEIASNGGSGTIQFSIDNGVSWSDDNEFTLNSGENYSIVIKDENDCEQIYANNPVSFEAIYASDVSIEVSPEYAVCAGETITLTAICADDVDFSWNLSSVLSSVLEVTEAIGSYDYTVTAVNQDNCSSQSTVEITFTDCTGVEQIEESAISIYPNPNTGEFSLEFETQKLPKAVRIYSTQGKMVFEQSSKELITNLMTFNLPNLHPGVYYTQIEFEGEIVIKKMVIKE
ncbi:MAG: T9SS type A sorting domain-containing protein, partial [Bacteroidales bacterium]|nr:T9SS type A sorting domain-containing protein [Bacteroidales bacterium]